MAVATELARRTGLADRVDFRQGSALDLPFPAMSFDLGWTQNVAMNISDRPRWYGEMHGMHNSRRNMSENRTRLINAVLRRG